MIVLLVIFSYIAVTICFIAWDAFIGLGYNSNDPELPPLSLVALFWPLSIPLLIWCSVLDKLDAIKVNRINRERKRIYDENHQRDLKEAAEREAKRILEEAEEEVEQEFKKKV